MTDLPAQFPRDSRWFDALLIVGGGLDVLHFTPVRQIAATLRGILATARERSPLVIVANSANLAASTLFHWPLDAVLSRRSLKVAGIFRNVCREFDVSFVNFAQPRECDPFSQNPGRFFGPDGFHPSADAYALCYRMIRARTPLRRALSPA
ncbi:MAG: hypothetical protein IPK20_18335 [Betaproteobacteria bacterium]|nr:hypothetical protein [Betaproteobacteria bacterium]